MQIFEILGLRIQDGISAFEELSILLTELVDVKFGSYKSYNLGN